jgi:hypothetical protein
MSMFSKVKALDFLSFERGKRMTAFDSGRIVTHGNVIVAQLPNGKIWTNDKSFREYAVMPGRYMGRMSSFCRCLVKLKIITNKEYIEHMASCAAAEKASDLRSDQCTLNRIAKKYNLPSPPVLSVRADLVQKDPDNEEYRDGNA